MRPVLGPDAEEHDAPWAQVDRHDRRTSCHQLLAPQPARRRDVGRRVAGEHRGLGRREALDRGEERAVRVETVGLFGHAVAERLAGVNLQPEDGARRRVLLAAQPALQVAHRHREPIDRQIRGRAKRDQRAALRDESREVLDAGLADAAAVLGAHRRGVVAVDNVAWRLIRKDEHVVEAPEPAAPDVGVVDRRDLELVLFEHPPRPPFVDVAPGPRRVHRHARPPEGDGARHNRRLCLAGADLQAELARDGLHRVTRDAAGRNLRRLVERQARAGLEEAVDRRCRVRTRVCEREPRPRPGHAPARGWSTSHTGQADAVEGCAHEADVHAEEQAERPRRDVVRRVRRDGLRSASEVGINLRLEKILRVPREDLGHRDDERTGRVLPALDLEGGLRAMHLDASHVEAFDQARRLTHIVLPVNGHQNGRDVARPAVFDRLPVDLVDLPEQRLAAIRHRLEQRDGRNEVVVDDVPESPAAAQPGARVLGARDDVGRRQERRGLDTGGARARRVAQGTRRRRGWGCRQRRDGRRPGRGAELIHRRGHAGARHLREQANLVVPPAGPRERTLPEVRVGRVVDDAVLARDLERGRL